MGQFEIQGVELLPDGKTYQVKARVYSEDTGEGNIGYNDNRYDVRSFNGHYLIDKIEYGQYIDLSQKDETSGWKTYTNKEYGFEFKYPSNFQLKNQYGEIFLLPGKGPKIYIFAGENLSAPNLECGGRCQYPESLVALSEKSGDWSKD